jgi:hypothetical protein
MPARTKHLTCVIAVLCATVALLWVGTSSALATRTYDSEITGAGAPDRTGGTITHFFDAIRIAIEANDQVRITNHNALYKYGAYPSQTLLGPQPDLTEAWGIFGIHELTMAANSATGQLYVADWYNRTLYAINANNVAEQPWDTSPGGASGGLGLFVAVDNTTTYSGGRLYLSLVSPENVVAAYDAHRRPVDFPATAPYIKGNRLTGTPSGPFGKVGFLAVDTEGNVYVVDQGHEVVYEFDSSGTFVRTFDGTGAPGEFSPVAVAVDPTNGNVLVEVENNGSSVMAVDEFDSSGNFLNAITSDAHGQLLGSGPPGAGRNHIGDLRVNSEGYLYVPSTSGISQVDIFTPNSVVPKVVYGAVSSPSTTSGVLNASVDPNGGGEVSNCHFEYGPTAAYGSGALPCEPGTHFTSATNVTATLSGLTAETAYHYRVVVEDANGTKYGADRVYVPHGVVGLETEPADGVSESTAVLHASFVGDGEPTHYRFDWGLTDAYGEETADQVVSPSNGNPEPLSAALTDLSPYTTYHFRVVASNGAGTSYGADESFTSTPGVPTVGDEAVSQVHSDRAILSSDVNPNGADTSYHFEFVPLAQFEATGFEHAVRAPVSDTEIGRGKHAQEARTLVDGLQSGTVYRYRTVANNQIGTGFGAVHTFTTFTFGFNDTCPNSHVRQQTGAALLLDCRAYELVSAANAGGYDVESDLVAGQTPFGGFPLASGPSRFLYGVHDGAIPGTGRPTNHGLDPYVATRGESGWSTKYVGIPASGTPSAASFASPLAEADSALGTFAFGGPALCSPCFADGSVGIPLHLPDGQLVQGMTGSIPQPDAEPEGQVGRSVSADGSHLVFGSKLQFEPDGNNNGDLTIYSRDLVKKETQVVSTMPSGATMTGPGIGELDISRDGSRVVVGRLISESGGASYWHLYMHVDGSSQSIDLTPGTTSGVLFDGMTADGSKVFFTTADRLTGDDEDNSADIYRADVGGLASTLTRVSAAAGSSAGGPGNTDLCVPSANTIHKYWNTTSSVPDCGVVAVGGAGGVASGDGTIYFLSPERLDGSSGVDNAPNLYAASPGAAPRFVATLESDLVAPLPVAAHPFARSLETFENPSGVAVDRSTGDIYVLEIGTDIGSGTVRKFNSSGQPVLSFGTNGRIQLPGMIGLFNVPTTIAVDNDPSSSSYRDLYVPSFSGAAVRKFDPSGSPLDDLSVGTPTAVAVDQANGHVYASSYFGSSVSVFDDSGTTLNSFSTIPSPTGVAADSSGKVYVVNGGGFTGNEGTAEIYDSSGNNLGQLDGNPSKGVAVDPLNDHVYVNEASRVIEFDASGHQVGLPIGSGMLKGSYGLTADSGNVLISNPGSSNVLIFRPAVVPPEPRTDNPLVIHSVSEPGVRHTDDFQVNTSGDDAVFTSTLPLTEYDNAEVHREIFRYDAGQGLACASCKPTGEPASGEASLPSNGLGLSNDGRVFFNSTEALVDRDLNERLDAYQWENGQGIQLISTGTSPSDSSLLGVSADGTDAYFFTRDTLVPEDENGSRVKVYDARAFGGYPIVPPPVPCKASDECHGAGTQAPPPPDIKTIAGAPVGNAVPPGRAGCKHGSVKRHGKCSRKRHHRRRRGKNKQKQATAHHRGGGR